MKGPRGLRAPVFPGGALRAAAELERERGAPSSESSEVASVGAPWGPPWGPPEGPPSGGPPGRPPEGGPPGGPPSRGAPRGPHRVRPLRPLQEAAALLAAAAKDSEKVRSSSKRNEVLLLRAEDTDLLLPGAPGGSSRTCMRCWVAVGPLYCSSCSKYLCGPCAAVLHCGESVGPHTGGPPTGGPPTGGPPTGGPHKVGTAARALEVDVHLSAPLRKQQQQDSFALDVKVPAARGIHCQRHENEPAKYACVDCGCA
ncbi:hypothetical protein, conserved [Eimeria necatrix]|uniref:B box-type domain-containing protein n=1 Tax=Eimeria necatrix TaxID=51315 RepID=U6N5C8_9EIME|nr:hypothetical protein, conserved [Eimeria necatrix]CDJ69100.1 hypothetical protein, conserved [Eimeria necatrix]